MACYFARPVPARYFSNIVVGARRLSREGGSNFRTAMRPAQWSAAAEDAYRDDGSVMPLHLAQVQDRYRAAVMGFAIGDALGFPLRGLPPSGMTRWATVAEDFVARPRGRFAKGQFSDDTQMMLAVAEAVAY